MDLGTSLESLSDVILICKLLSFLPAANQSRYLLSGKIFVKNGQFWGGNSIVNIIFHILFSSVILIVDWKVQNL